MNFNKSLTVVATAAALIAGVAYAQTNPVPPTPNTTGESGAQLGNTNPGAGSTLNNANTMGTTDSSATTTPNAQSDIVSPAPRADRN